MAMIVDGVAVFSSLIIIHWADFSNYKLEEAFKLKIDMDS
jgi:hypothetical protein